MSKGVVLMISNDFPPVSGGQSRYLYDLWSCLPAEEIAIMAPEIDGAEEVDAALRCRRDGLRSQVHSSSIFLFLYRLIFPTTAYYFPTFRPAVVQQVQGGKV